MLFNFILLILSTNTYAASPIEACKDYECLYNKIYKDTAANFKYSDCEVLDGKKSIDFLSGDMGELCRLYVARKEAGGRNKSACFDDGSMNPDWSMSISSAPMFLPFREIYNSLPNDFKDIADFDPNGGYNNSTIYKTYVYSKSSSRSYKNSGKKDKVELEVYFCQTKLDEKAFMYIPYFYIARKYHKGESMKDLKLESRKMEYIATPSLINEKVLGQFPTSLRRDVSNFELIDLNSDGHNDLVFLHEKNGYKNYHLEACIYNPKETNCRHLESNDGVKSDIWHQQMEIKKLSNGNYELVVKNKNDDSKFEKFRFKFSDQGFELIK